MRVNIRINAIIISISIARLLFSVYPVNDPAQCQHPSHYTSVLQGTYWTSCEFCRVSKKVCDSLLLNTYLAAVSVYINRYVTFGPFGWSIVFTLFKIMYAFRVNTLMVSARRTNTNFVDWKNILSIVGSYLLQCYQSNNYLMLFCIFLSKLISRALFIGKGYRSKCFLYLCLSTKKTVKINSLFPLANCYLVRYLGETISLVRLVSI